MLSDRVSHLAKAFEGWNEGLKTYIDPPKGMFGKVAIIKSGKVAIDSRQLDVEFTVPFDDDLEPNEAEIIVYNLTKTTIQELKEGKQITITAGYGSDIGVIFKGEIKKIRTKHEGVDKKTVIKAKDYIGGSESKLTDKTYAAGTKASYILKDLLNYLTPPLAVFRVKRDHTYKDEVKISGNVWESIKTYAQVCGISVYTNKGYIYARHLTEGDNTYFIADESHGLIGSPEEFEEERQVENYKDTIKGYNIQMLLQHRITTASILGVGSREVKGNFRARKGTHRFNQSECITEVEVIQ